MIPLEADLLRCLDKLGVNHKYLRKIPDELKLFSNHSNWSKASLLPTLDKFAFLKKYNEFKEINDKF